MAILSFIFASLSFFASASAHAQVTCALPYKGSILMIQAIRVDDAACVSAALSQGVGVNDEISTLGDSRGNWELELTPVAYAAKKGALKSLDLLIDAGGNPGWRNRYFVSPLMVAAAYKRSDSIELLVKKGAKVDEMPLDPSGSVESALGFAVQADLATAETLLKLGANPNQLSAGRLPLSHLAFDKKAIETFLKFGADVRAVDARGDTVLHYAVFYWEPAVDAVEFLIASGADIEAKNVDGEAPLSLVARTIGSIENMKALIAAGADVNARTKGDVTVLMSATMDSVDKVELLVQSGAEVNAIAVIKDYSGKDVRTTALDMARKVRNWEVIRYLEGIGAASAQNLP